MTLPALLWAVTAAFLWRLGSGQIPSQERIPVLHLKLSGSKIIFCDCSNSLCDGVYWYRSLTSNNNLQFLVYFNSAGRSHFPEGVKHDQFKPTKRGNGFELTIINFSADDAGLYSCVLKNRGPEDGWKPGVQLQLKVTPPQPLPKKTPKKKTPPVSDCDTESDPKGGCVTLVLWLLVGVCASLTLALTSILYYFGRLPKKCRHHYVRKPKAIQ